MITYNFDLTKTLQLIALWLKTLKKAVTWEELNQRLLISDCSHITDIGFSITGSLYVLRKNELVNKYLYEVLFEEVKPSKFWQYFSFKENQIALIKDPGSGELCEAEENCLGFIATNLDYFKQTQTIKDLPNFYDSDKGYLDWSNLLMELGWEHDDLKDLQEQIEYSKYIDKILN